MHSLQRFLADYDLAMLRAVANKRGVTLSTNRQPDAVDQLAASLLDPLSVRVAVAQLSAAARSALDALLLSGGRMRAPHFMREYGAVRPIGPGRLEREALWQAPASATEELLYTGLLFRAFHADEGGAGEFVFLPTDLVPQLPQPPTGPHRFRLEQVGVPSQAASPGRAGLEGGVAAIEDMFTYLVYVQNHAVRPYADGRLAQRDLLAIRGQLVDAEERRFSLLRHLAGRLGFVVRREGALRLEAGPVRQWLSAGLVEQVSALQVTWRDDPERHDLCQVPGLECDRESGWLRRIDPVATRRAILALLSLCPADEWWTASSFVAAVKVAHPDFQRPDGDYGSWYLRDAACGEYLSGFESWDQVEGRLIADLLTGPLRWLGVVVTQQSKSGPVCRLTGEEVLQRLVAIADEQRDLREPVEEDEGDRAPAGRLVVRPDFQIEVPEPGNLYVRFQVERFADRLKGDPLRFRLSSGSLSRALSQGLQVDPILAFLHQAREGPLPANVIGQLRLWAGRYGQASLEEAALLTVKHERVLKELSILPETRSLIDRVLTPTMALVRSRHLPRLRKEMRNLGYLPPEASEGSPEPE